MEDSVHRFLESVRAAGYASEPELALLNRQFLSEATTLREVASKLIDQKLITRAQAGGIAQ